MRTVFVDVDTQLDFLYPAGALYVPGAEHIVPAIARLNRYAADHGIPIVSTVDAHTEDDPEFKVWPKHCVAGTHGQRKPAETLVAGAGQHIVEKQTVDVFQCPALGPLIQQLAPERVVVYGVVTEICVLNAVRGLVRMGLPVTVVTDSIKALTDDASDHALTEMRTAGVTLTGLASICGS